MTYEIEPNGAILSPDRLYRYALWRLWERGTRVALFVGLNPSTADETQDDPTIRRCIAFAKSWGCGGMFMGNLYGWRATDPSELRHVENPIGPRNDATLLGMAAASDIVVAAWGAGGDIPGYPRRGAQVCAMLPRVHYLRLNKNGSPAHPLYLPKTLKPTPWYPID